MSQPKVLIRKILTEKTSWQATSKNTYVFLVDNSATKPQIAAAVESEYQVKVEAVRTQTRSPRQKRFRQHRFLTDYSKRALVTLRTGDAIALY